MKKILSIFLLSCISAFSFAQVKNRICIVDVSYEEALTKTVKGIGSLLSVKGIADAQKNINNIIDGGCFGSGIAYIDSNGKNYVLTNSHVVENAGKISIIFVDNDGNKTTYDNIKIKAFSKDTDLALLELPDDTQPFTKVLPFYTEPLVDGQTVYTAGFPGLNGQPSWQFGTGTITNASTIIPELVDPSVSKLIQHSAQVDSGNSGGALLIRQDNKYYLVGVNTWSYRSRQATNISIPAITAQNFINDALNGKEADTSNLMKRAEALQTVLDNWDCNFEEIIPYISDEYLISSGNAMFDYTTEKCSKGVFNAIINKIYYNSPIDGIKYAMGWNIFKEYHKGELVDSVKTEKLPLSEAQKDESTGNYIIKYPTHNNKSEAISEWIISDGKWKLISLSSADTKNNKKTLSSSLNLGTNTTSDSSNKRKSLRGIDYLKIPEGKGIQLGNISVYEPYLLDVNLGNTFFDSLNTFCPFIDFNLRINDIFLFNFNAQFEIETKYKIRYVGGWNTPVTSMSYLPGVQIQLPIYLRSVSITPYTGINFGYSLKGMNMPNKNNSLTADSTIGFRLRFNTDKEHGIGININTGYKANTDVVQFTKHGTISGIDNTRHALFFSLGVGFLK